MTLQEILDKVAEGLTKQNKQSISKTGICYYRNSDGSKCAAGWIIPDELYDKRMELRPFSALFELHKKLDLDRKAVDFISQLQTMHDYSAVIGWKRKMKELAVRYNLMIPQCLMK